jgi:putative flippase GtrA
VRVPASPLTRELIRYATVGVGNTIVTLASYSGLIAAGSPYVAASAVAFILAALTSYLGNRTWTFARTEIPHRTAAPRYLAVVSLGLLTDVATIAALVDGLGAPKMLAQVLVIPVVAAQGFILSRLWAFRVTRWPGVAEAS